MRVVVTGAAGRLARVLLPKLCADPDVDRVTGIDRVPSALVHAKFEHVVADVADASVRGAMRGAGAVVHLAFLLTRGRLPLHEMARSNVAGSQALLAAAADAGIVPIVHLSSAAVYGGGVDLAEDAPLTPLPRFDYARQKAQVETWVARELPRATVLRPAIILGPNAQPLLKQLAKAPCYVRLREPHPQLQCVHEDDVVRALLAALKLGASGPYNLAAPSSFTLRELVRSSRPRAPGLPLALVRAGVTLAWHTTGWGGEPGWLDGTTISLTLDCSRARALLGWQPRYKDWREIVASSQ